MTDSYPNWFDENKFKNILAIIESNKFNYRHEIGEFNYIGIKDLVNNIRNNAISEIPAEKGLNTLNKIKNAGIVKYKKCTPGQQELLNLFKDLLETILIDKTLESKNQKDDENENGNKNRNENENDENKAENKNMLLEYMEDVDDKLFKKYSKSKNCNSFINEFDRATNHEDKEKVVKDLKDMGGFVNHEIFILNGNNEYKSKLIGVVNCIDYFLCEYSKT